MDDDAYFETFKTGGFSYQAVLRRMVKNFQQKQAKVGYLEQLINSQEERTEDEKLAIKKIHI